MSAAPLHILVVGASGSVGVHITRSLLHRKKSFKVRVLANKASLENEAKKKLIAEFKSEGAEILYGDIKDAETLKVATSHIDFVLSAVGFPSFDADQLALLAAAKANGVKRFIPSEFGFDCVAIGEGSSLSLLDAKLKIQKAVKSSGLEWTIFETGLFTEYFFGPFFGFDFEKATVNVSGSTETRIVTTALKDIGEFVAEALLSPTSKNAHIKLAGASLTYGEAVAAVEKATGKKWTQNIVSLEQAKATQANPPDFLTGLIAGFQQVLIIGKGTSWPASSSWNSQHLPHYHLTKVDQYLQQLVSSHKH